MIRKVLAGALCVFALVSSAGAEEAPPATAETPAPAESAPPAAKPAQPIVGDPNEVICKNEEVIGTRFAKRICMTRAQREARAKAARETLQGQQKNSGGAPENLGGG